MTDRSRTWRNWLVGENRLSEERVAELFFEQLLDRPWEPTAEDRKAAWELYTELRTRIATERLHYRSGNEKRALESLAELFGSTRKVIRDHGPECRSFAVLATAMLNGVVRRFTAKWHKRQVDGHLANEDVCHEFRAELLELQDKLRPFLYLLGALAEGDDQFVPDKRPDQGEPQSPPDEQAGESEEPTNWWPASAAKRREKLLGRDGIDQPILFDIDLPGTLHDEPAKLLNSKAKPSAAERESLRRHEMTEAIRQHERTAIEQRRRAAGLEADATSPIGLAISGGGIRSATFALGVVQRLAQTGMLHEADYLSTVSGGGYTGSFLSSYLNSEPRDSLSPPRPEISLQPPTGTEYPLPFLGPNDNESAALRWIRNHSKYLLYGGFIRKLQIFGMVTYGVAVNLFLTLPVIAILVLLTHWTLGSELALTPLYDTQPAYPIATECWAGLAFVWGLVIVGLLAAGLGPMQMCLHSSSRFRWMLDAYENLCCWALLPLAAILVINALPAATYGFHRLLGMLQSPHFGIEINSQTMILVTVVSTALPLLTASLTHWARNRKWLGPVMKVLFGLSGPLFFVAMYFLLIDWLIVDKPREFAWWGLPKGCWVGLFAVVPLVYGLFLLNVNFSSLHRFYRNRLSEAYLVREKPRSKSGESSGAAVTDCVEHVDVQKLSELRKNNPAAPYHLINTALNVPSSKEPELRGRDCDFFLFSQGYCGSTLTGYLKTADLEKLDWHLDLGTALAISGAAVSPYMGVGTERSLKFLLTLLNARMGYWLPNPGCRSGLARAGRWATTANGWYLFRELFGWLHEKSTRVNLSDGGHIENLGLYELLRRRCKFIIAIDGEHDGDVSFPSLMRLIRYAAIDLNADIRFPQLDDLKPRADGWSSSHFTIGVVRYRPRPGEEGPSADLGVIVYFKSAVTGNEPAAVLDYRHRHAAFPHETTADQFFEEDQFEAYRALGFHSADESLREEILQGEGAHGLDMRTWIKKLVENLLPD